MDLSLNLKKTPCRALKTTRRYQESEGAVMYFVCKGCGHYVCKDHMNMIVTCDSWKNKDENESD